MFMLNLSPTPLQMSNTTRKSILFLSSLKRGGFTTNQPDFEAYLCVYVFKYHISDGNTHTQLNTLTYIIYKIFILEIGSGGVPSTPVDYPEI